MRKINLECVHNHHNKIRYCQIHAFSTIQQQPTNSWCLFWKVWSANIKTINTMRKYLFKFHFALDLFLPLPKTDVTHLEFYNWYTGIFICCKICSKVWFQLIDHCGNTSVLFSLGNYLVWIWQETGSSN
jgi:hypothetical protein